MAVVIGTVMTIPTLPTRVRTTSTAMISSLSGKPRPRTWIENRTSSGRADPR